MSSSDEFNFESSRKEEITKPHFNQEGTKKEEKSPNEYTFKKPIDKKEDDKKPIIMNTFITTDKSEEVKEEKKPIVNPPKIQQKPNENVKKETEKFASNKKQPSIVEDEESRNLSALLYLLLKLVVVIKMNLKALRGLSSKTLTTRQTKRKKK